MSQTIGIPLPKGTLTHLLQDIWRIIQDPCYTYEPSFYLELSRAKGWIELLWVIGTD